MKTPTYEQFDILNDDKAALDESSNAMEKYGLTANTRIVRYISSERYLQMIETKDCYNELSLVTRWDDPYEACLLRANDASGSSDGMKGLCESIQDYYGQCWMLKVSDGEKDAGKKEDDTFESDVVWRAYCPNKDGVRIETTVGALVKSIKKCLPKMGVDEKSEDEDASSVSLCRMGRVSYGLDTLKKLLAESKNGYSACDATNAIVSSLFVKRREFSDEREVRVLLKASPEPIKRGNEKGLLSFEHGGCRMRDIEFIKGVLVDPRMPRHRAEEILCRTRIALGMKSDSDGNREIGRSTLYEWPEFTKAIRTVGKMANANYELWKKLQEKYPHDGVIDLKKRRSVPTRSYWTGLPCGETGCCFAFTCCRTVTRIELYLGKNDKTENKGLCQLLEAQRETIEQKLRTAGLNSIKVDFDPLPKRIASRISLRHENFTAVDLSASRDEIVRWFCTVMPPFAKAMKEALSEIKDAGVESGPDGI